LRRSADQLADAGTRVEESQPDVEFASQFELFMQLVGGATSPSSVDDDPEGMFGSHRAWLRAEEERAALRRIWAQWFEQFDVLLCPAMSIPACEHNQRGAVLERVTPVNGVDVPVLATSQWLGLVGVLGLPSVVAPIGRTQAGLPVGVQMVAPYLHDRRAIRIAGLTSALLGGYEVPPGFS